MLRHTPFLDGRERLERDRKKKENIGRESDKNDK